MKPTQQRTEEGELPALEVWQDDYGRLSAEMKSPYFRDFGPGRHEYVPASRVTALELERAKEELRKHTHHRECDDGWYSCPKAEGYINDDGRTECDCGADRVVALLRDLGEGQ